MGDRKKGLLIALSGLVLLVFAALTLTTQSPFYGLIAMSGIGTTLLPLSVPFVLLQLALCKFCPWRPLRFAPLVLSGGGLLWSWWYLEQSGGWDALLALMVMLPCVLGLLGSGLGWLLWYLSRKHL